MSSDYRLDDDYLDEELKLCYHPSYMDYTDACKWAENTGHTLDNLVLMRLTLRIS